MPKLGRREKTTAKIILDPGHVEGYNRGAVSGYYEGTAMYHYAYRLADKLRAAGLDVGITRTKITDNPSLTDRGKQAKGADMFVSLHSNAASSASANGVTVFYSIKRNADKPHATKWCNGLAALINGGTRARGASTRKGSGNWDYYTVIQSAVAAGCPHVFLIEHGFHSNPGECAWLMQAGNLETMAALEARLICDILGIKSSDGAAQEPASMGQKMVNTPGDTLNVRDEANAKGTKLGELKDRSLVEVYGLAGNGWVLIQQGSLRGWVNGKYLTDYTAKPELTRILKLKSPNMRGEDVRWAQARLNALGYNSGTPDGIFGPNTDKAVKAFQRANGLSQDGDIGPKTWAKL